MRASETISLTLPGLTMHSSMFFSDSTTSRSVSIAKRVVACWFSPSAYLPSRNSRSSFDFLPIALAFHWPTAPDGSVWNSYGLPSAKPVRKVETPKGRVPPLCVYFC